MDEREWLTERFEAHRPRLRAVAYRMLGSLSEAEDALQDSWLRLDRADTGNVENLEAWLTTVVAAWSSGWLRSLSAPVASTVDRAQQLSTGSDFFTAGLAHLPDMASKVRSRTFTRYIAARSSRARRTVEALASHQGQARHLLWSPSQTGAGANAHLTGPQPVTAQVAVRP